MAAATTPPSSKGVERKAHILDVALRVIGRDGLAELSMRSLASEAAVPLGALGYYFPNKRALIVEAFEAHSQRELQRVIRLISSVGRAGSADDLGAGLAEFAIEGLQDAQLALVAEYEYMLEASRRPELARASSAWQQSLHTHLAEVVARLGSADPQTDARIIMAVMAGVEVDNLTGAPPTPAQREAIRETMMRLCRTMGCAWRAAASDSM